MKKISTSILFLLIVSYCFAQETSFKEYSYSEFFELIEAEQDSVFTLKNAIINPNKEKDSLHEFTLVESTWEKNTYEFNRKDTLHIYKQIDLDNVHFIGSGSNNSAGIYNIVFHKKVQLKNTLRAYFTRCTFNEKVILIQNENLVKALEVNNGKHNSMLKFDHSVFLDGVSLDSNKFNEVETENTEAQIVFENSKFYNTSNSWKHSSFWVSNIIQFAIENCIFYDKGTISISSLKTNVFWVRKNVFHEQTIDLFLKDIDDSFASEISGNSFNEFVIADVDKNSDKFVFEWDQLKKGILDRWSYQYFYSFNFDHINRDEFFNYQYHDDNLNAYKNSYRIEDKRAYRSEMKMLGGFYDNYKTAHDTESANAVYMEMKDLETVHLKFLYKQNPTFDTFFTLKINQFLKAFSGYGTRPSKAIIFSMYVILVFAFIYLLFPNSWDKHGKNRIINRYRFFTKYMNKKAGIHEVYLEDKQQELLEYEDFKNYMNASDKYIPKFFTVTALPLYKWAISGTKLSASLLKRVDIMKGTWSELPQHKRVWKSILLIGAFLIAVIYDIFIKMLNALMLSINTFTTLGFGEIPIKGLPRYLAIIQGFIGWFMLTIFSVSLISQLLN